MVQEVQQAVHVTKGLIQVRMKVNQWKCLSISSFILKKKTYDRAKAHEGMAAC